MKIYNLEPHNFSVLAKQKLEQFGQYHETSKRQIELMDNKEDVEVIITRLGNYLDSQFFLQFKNLKYVLSATTGQNHINIKYLSSKKIIFINLKGETEFLNRITSTPQLAFALLINLNRNIHIASKSVSDGNWNRDAYFGRQLDGQKLGIIGLGRTGKQMAKYAEAFNMEIIFYDPYLEDDKIFGNYTRVNSLEEIFLMSDAISIHVHLNPETKYLINNHFLNNTKSNLIIINTSRGEIVNEIDIVNWLKNRPLSKYGTDVLETELSDIKKSPIWQYLQQSHQVLITPHIGGASYEALHACEEFLVDKLISKLKMKF